MTLGPPYFSRGTSLKPRSKDHTGCRPCSFVPSTEQSSSSTCISLIIGAFWLLLVLQSLVGCSVDKLKENGAAFTH